LTRTETSMPNAIKGAVLTSGMFDLAPVRLSARSAYVSFTDTSANALSPLHHLEHISTPILLAYGALETPEFIRQSNAFHDALTETGKASEIIVGRNYNHFEIIETLANPYGLLGAAALRQMGLCR
ncbi:MAG: alpha/beta hydrolase family protein, partial [Alphaproteobacteria bacterium]